MANHNGGPSDPSRYAGGRPLPRSIALAHGSYAAAMAPAGSHPSLSASNQTQLVTVIVGLLLILAIIAIAAVMRGRRGSGGDGYPAGGDVIVRCREGHLFTTIWIPFMSVKAIRFGPVRYQYCPV